jgi:hypothetical protein
MALPQPTGPLCRIALEPFLIARQLPSQRRIIDDFRNGLGLTASTSARISRHAAPMKVNPWRVIIPVVLVTAVIAITTAQGANSVSMVIALAAVAIAVCWIAFPLIVISKFNELLKVDREIMDALREIAKE